MRRIALLLAFLLLSAVSALPADTPPPPPIPEPFIPGGREPPPPALGERGDPASSQAPREVAGEARVDVWPWLAGMRKELEGEELELRDELIPAHQAYLSALEAALAEAMRIPSDDERLAPAWARVEYLLETCFRLLDNTGEHEGFLKITAALKPAWPLPPEPIGMADAESPPPDESGGLIYENADGERLVPRQVGSRTLLFEAGADMPISADESVSARPAVEEAPAPDAFKELIRARAAWLRALVLERLGRTREAGEETAGLGLIRNWLVLGPLDRDSVVYSEIAMDVEELYEFLGSDRKFPGKVGPVSWRPHASADPLGRLFPEALFRSDGPKAAYALTLVHSEANREAVIRFGSNAQAAINVNHVQARRDQFAGFSDPDQEAFNVWLRKGWNVILVKTNSSPDGSWGMAARLTGLDGAPLPCRVARCGSDDIAAVLAEVRRASRRSVLDRFFLPAKMADMGGVSILSRRLVSAPDDARANFYLASFLAARRMLEGPDRFDRELIFRRAVELSDENPYFTLMAARSVEAGVEGPEREENLRLVLLRSAADKGSAAALTDIGRLYLDVMRQPRRADAYADEALSVNPMSLRAGILDYDIAVSMGWKPVAGELLKRLVTLHPSAAQARLRLGRASLQAGRYGQALAEFHAILGSDARNREAINGAVMALGMLGQTSAAVELLSLHLERFPYDSAVRLKLAGLYRTLGRDDEAMTVLAAALDMAPDDAEAQVMRMDIAREVYAEGKGEDVAAHRRVARQELDMSPSRRQVKNGWEYLYFQVEDRMELNGSINRTVAFALRIYSGRAARALRHLGFTLDQGLERGSVTKLSLVYPDGRRDVLTPMAQAGDGGKELRFNLPPLQVGMMVEAEVEIRRMRIPFLGEYFGQIAPLTQPAPARLSRYMFTAPKGARMFFRPVNGAPEAMVAESPDGREVTRIWEMSDLPAFSPEPNSPGQNELMPCVQVSSFGDWDEFARWYWRLFGGQYHTPPELRRLARRLAMGETIPLDKLDRAAEWIAANLGHREWEFGPYAFRPINARSILSRLSADGKDRALLLCLLAREYDLKAWPVLARLRDNRFAPTGSEDLALPLLEHFNHSLVMVKTELGGDIFLDASNPYRPPGVMPSQLFGSPGMAITPDAADRIVIPDDGASGCRWDEVADMTVDEDGSVLWEERIDGVGTAAETLRMRFKDPEGRNEVWTSFLASIGADPSATAAGFSEDAAAPASASFNGRARLRRLAKMEDDRVVLNVPPLPGASLSGRPAFPLSLDEIAAQGVREQELLLPHGFRISRRLTISHPPEWKVANRHSPFRMERAFGSVELKVESAPGVLVYDFVLEIPGHRLSAEEFEDFRSMAAQARRWARPLMVWEKQ